MADSRLKKHLQKKAFKNTALALLGIILLLALLFQFGPQLLITFSVTLDKLRGGQNTSTISEDVTYIAPPMIDPLESATNSAKIKISGYSQPEQIIKLYVNGEMVDNTEVKSDKSFIFENVDLTPGENEIKAKATIENKQSDYSQVIKVTYVDKPPSLDISFPSDGQTFPKDKDSLNITGKTDSENKITVNGFWAIVDGEGTFSHTISLQDGENKIKVEATDPAGNKTTKEITIKSE